MKEYFNLMKSAYLNIPSPLYVCINLTNKCNQHCVYCEIGQNLMETAKPLLELDDIKWVISQMGRFNIPTLMLGGGEPLLFKDIFELILYAHRLGIKCNISTNGMLLSHLSKDEVTLLKMCDTKVLVSIDSFSTDTEEYIRGVKKALSFPIEGIDILLKQQIPLGISTVISSHNYQGLFDTVVNANKLGVFSIKFQPVIFASNFPEVEAITNKIDNNVLPEHLSVIESQFQEILEFEKVNPIKTNVDVLCKWLPNYIRYSSSAQFSDEYFFKGIVNKFWCGTIYSSIVINYYGEILPCYMMKANETINIKNRANESLLELWNKSCSPLRSVIQRQQYPSTCKSCSCDFDFNYLASTLKYPFNNYHLLAVPMAKIFKKKILRRR